MQKVKNFFSRLSRLQIILSVIVVVMVALLVFRGGSTVLAEIVVERGDVEQEVVATGKVKPAEEVNLGFSVSGRIASVGKGVGERVRVGDILLALDQSENLANLKKARASLDDAKINLEKIGRTSPSSYDSAYDKAVVALLNVYTKASDAVFSTADRFFTNVDTGAPTFHVYYISGSNIYDFHVDDVVSGRVATLRSDLSETLASWKSKINSARLEGGDLNEEFTISEMGILRVKDFMSELALALGSMKSYDQSYDTIIAGFKSSVADARSSLNTAESDLLSAKSEYLNAPRLSGSGITGNFDEILSQQAKVSVAEADVEYYQSQLAKQIIASPINGVVTKQDGEVGEIANSNVILVSVISDQDLQIEADISEINIGKLKVGDSVSVSFDAFPDERVPSRISSIEPGDVLVDGVVNYKIKVQFIEKPILELKTGLTASLYIQSAKKSGVLFVPAYTVKKIEGREVVSIKNIETGEIEERAVVTGLRGKGGIVEIISGLREGEVVLGENRD